MRGGLVLRSESVDLDSVIHCLFIACINRRRRLNFQLATEPASLTFLCGFRGLRGICSRIDDGGGTNMHANISSPSLSARIFAFALG